MKMKKAGSYVLGLDRGRREAEERGALDELPREAVQSIADLGANDGRGSQEGAKGGVETIVAEVSG